MAEVDSAANPVRMFNYGAHGNVPMKMSRGRILIAASATAVLLPALFPPWIQYDPRRPEAVKDDPRPFMRGHSFLLAPPSPVVTLDATMRVPPPTSPIVVDRRQQLKEIIVVSFLALGVSWLIVGTARERAPRPFPSFGVRTTSIALLLGLIVPLPGWSLIVAFEFAATPLASVDDKNHGVSAGFLLLMLWLCWSATIFVALALAGTIFRRSRSS